MSLRTMFSISVPQRVTRPKNMGSGIELHIRTGEETLNQPGPRPDHQLAPAVLNNIRDLGMSTPIMDLAKVGILTDLPTFLMKGSRVKFGDSTPRPSNLKLLSHIHQYSGGACFDTLSNTKIEPHGGASTTSTRQNSKPPLFQQPTTLGKDIAQGTTSSLIKELEGAHKHVIAKLEQNFLEDERCAKRPTGWLGVFSGPNSQNMCHRAAPSKHISGIELHIGTGGKTLKQPSPEPESQLAPAVLNKDSRVVIPGPHTSVVKFEA
ncbi:hypothetical protein BU17DRAFT_92945 [Hysterangium stoloniferum]|nr:hypothetical protein BU17DRAFT_92945 [Hysterangium stoloniferum]